MTSWHARISMIAAWTSNFKCVIISNPKKAKTATHETTADGFFS